MAENKLIQLTAMLARVHEMTFVDFIVGVRLAMEPFWPFCRIGTDLGAKQENPALRPRKAVQCPDVHRVC